MRTLADGKTRAHSSASLFFAALRGAINLHEQHRSHPRYVSGLAYLFAFWINFGKDYATVVGDARLYEVASEEIKALGCPGTLADVRKWAQETVAKSKADIRSVHELIKLDLNLFSQSSPTAEQQATAALKAHADRR